jgi:hypothetical protein
MGILMVDFESEQKHRISRRELLSTAAALGGAILFRPATARAASRDKQQGEAMLQASTTEVSRHKNRHFNERNQKLAKKVMEGVATTMLEQYRKTQKSADPENPVPQDLFRLEDLNEAGTIVKLSHDSYVENGSGSVSVTMRRINGHLVPATASNVTVSTAKEDGSMVNSFVLNNSPQIGLVFEAAYGELDSSINPVFISTSDYSNREPPTSSVLHRALGQIPREAHRVLADEKVVTFYPPRDIPPELSGAVVLR